MHIGEEHGDIADIPSFVSDIAKNYNEIWRTSSGRLLLAKRQANVKNGKLAIVELQPSKSGDYYSVVTAFRSREPKGDSLLWSVAQSHSADSGIRPALQTQHLDAGGAGQSAKQKEDRQTIAQDEAPHEAEKKTLSMQSIINHGWSVTGDLSLNHALLLKGLRQY